MKLLKIVIIAGIMLSGIVVPPTDNPDPVPFCYASDCTDFW